MGKSKATVYSCDICDEKFFESDEVFDIKDIADGDDKQIIGECMI